MRKPIPQKIKMKVLTRNRHSCCICGKDGLFKEVIIHHIDGNPNNNLLSNLAVLCLNHASMADAGLKKGKLGSGQKLKPEAVRIYKNQWEKKTEIELSAPRKYLSVRERKQLELMYRYEINKMKNEILALPDNDRRVKEKFNFFEQLIVEEFISGLKLRQILCDAFSDIAIQSIDSINVTCRLGRAVWHLFMHLVGPDKVRIRHEDIKLFFKSLRILESAGSFAAEFAENDKPLSQICATFYDLAEIASWYHIKNSDTKIIYHLKKIAKDCKDYESENKNRKITIRKRRGQIVKKTIDRINKLSFCNR